MKTRVFSAALALLISVQTADAAMITLKNMGFDSGGLADWGSSGNVSVGAVFRGFETEDVNKTRDIDAYSGSSVFLKGDSLISQDVSIKAGDTLAFMYRFVAGDFWPNNDFATLSIGGENVRISDVSLLDEDFGDSGWLSFQWTASADYIGPAIFSISNYRDAMNDSLLALDTASPSPVPLPPALWSFVVGLVGLAGLGKKRVRGS